MNRSELKKFGLTFSGMLVLFFGLLIPWIWSLPVPVWPWILAAALSSMALVVPASLRPIYQAWTKFAEVLGWINTRIILGLVFFVLILPVGLVMRLFRDPLHRRPDPSAPSYRLASRAPRAENMEKPF